MTNSPIDQFFALRSRELLLKPDFVLALESDMLFPSESKSGLALDYTTFLALLAGSDSIPTAADFAKPPPPPRGAMGAYNGLRQPMPVEVPVDSWRLYPSWDENGDAEFPAADDYSYSLPPRDLIQVHLQSVEALRPYRIAFDQSRSQEKWTKKSIREATAEGQICAVFLEMQRLLVGTKLKTRKGKPATPSRNIVGRVCEAYNFGRARMLAGPPEGERESYPTFNENEIKEVWRKKHRGAALWAAHRALSPLPFDAVPPSHLLNELDLDEFLHLSLVYEDDRLAIEAERATTPLNALGPPDAFEALRKVVETHVPDYAVIKKPKKAKRKAG